MGIIVAIGEVKTFKSGFRTRYVIVDNGSSSNPNPIKIDCRNNDIDTLNACNVNDVIEVLYEIKGRKWEDKYFVNIVAESLRKVGEVEKAPDIDSYDYVIPGNSLEEQDEWERLSNNKEDVPF